MFIVCKAFIDTFSNHKQKSPLSVAKHPPDFFVAESPPPTTTSPPPPGQCGRAGRRKQLFLTPLALPRDELLTAGGCKKPQNNTSQLNTRTSRPKLYPCWTHELFQHSKEPGNFTCYLFCRILREHLLLEKHQPHVKCDPLYHIVQLSHEPPLPHPASPQTSPCCPLMSQFMFGGESESTN